MHVIARAYGDRPLRRLLTGVRGDLAYVVNPSTGNASGTTPLSGVGFPLDCVSMFDEQLFESLENAWSAGDHHALTRLWEKATPLREPDKIAA